MLYIDDKVGLVSLIVDSVPSPPLVLAAEPDEMVGVGTGTILRAGNALKG